MESLLLPSNFKPGPCDVICAKGVKAMKHSGNERYRALVMQSLHCYRLANTRQEKSRIISSVVDELVRENGRLVIKKGDSWHGLSDQMTHARVGQCFRNFLFAETKPIKEWSSRGYTRSKLASKPSFCRQAMETTDAESSGADTVRQGEHMQKDFEDSSTLLVDPAIHGDEPLPIQFQDNITTQMTKDEEAPNVLDTLPPSLLTQHNDILFVSMPFHGDCDRLSQLVNNDSLYLLARNKPHSLHGEEEDEEYDDECINDQLDPCALQAEVTTCLRSSLSSNSNEGRFASNNKAIVDLFDPHELHQILGDALS